MGGGDVAARWKPKTDFDFDIACEMERKTVFLLRSTCEVNLVGLSRWYLDGETGYQL